MERKISLLLLTLFASVYICQAAIIDGTCGTNLTWSLNTRDSTLVIEGSGSMDNWSKEGHSDSSPVNVPWYEYKNYIAHINLSDNVTTIGSYAFYKCTNLISVIIPNNVTTIKGYSFLGCSNLRSITIGKNVTNIENYSFTNCNKLEHIVWNARNYADASEGQFSVFKDINAQIRSFIIGENVVHIPAFICYGMSNLSSIQIPNSVSSIGKNAFSSCSALTSVSIGNGVTNIGENVFQNCYNVCSVHINNLSSWCSIEFSNEYSSPSGSGNGEYNLYLNGELVKNIVIPSEINSIHNYTFRACKSLESVTIHNNVTTIGISAFERCSELTHINIPNSVTNIEDRAFSGCSSLTSLAIPNSVTSIGEGVFSNCSSLSSVTLPNSITSIGASVFSSCSSLTSIEIPNSVTSIGAGAFSYCHSLTSIEIPNGVTSIGAGAFSYCHSLESLTIPNTVVTIGQGAFFQCDKLPFVYIPSSVTVIGNNAFYDCSNLKSLVLNSNSIVGSTYNSTNNLSSIFGSQVEECMIDSNVTIIGGYVFYGWTNLISLIISKNVTSIASLQLCGCNKLTKLSLDANCCVTSVADIFGSQIRECNIGNHVTEIPIRGFRWVKSLREITIGEGVYNIGDDAFYGCDSLLKITCEATTPPSSKSSSFPNKNIPLYVPEESIELYSNAIWWEEFYQILPIPSGKYTISVDAINGEVEGAGEYESGTLISLVAIPNEGYTFSHWSDGNTDNPRTIIVSGNATYTAIFRAESSSNNLIFTSYKNSSTIGLASLASHQVLEYSIDRINWINMTTTTTISLNNGESIYIRGVLSDNNTSTDYTQFSISGAIAVYGNINYLWNYQELEMPLKGYCGTNLFRDCTGLIYAPSLPAATLTRGCYNSMFRNCANLQSAPSLPATILASECYKDMFHDCIHLSSAPSLPATELAGDCYCSMFYGCSSLDSAPALPAEKLAYRCYGYMFKNCTSLTIAPALPAKELANYCYWRMFLGCSALSQVPEILPAKELTTYCYNQMFMQTAITRAPELPAKTLGEYSYYQMFYQCNKLKYIKCLATDISATGCTQGWVNGVATSGTFVKNSQMSSWSNGKDGIPNGWSIQDYVVKEYVVNFVDWDGTILKSEQVEEGHAATAPANPTRENFTFVGWDKDFSSVKENTTVTAQYEHTGPTAEKTDSTSISAMVTTDGSVILFWPEVVGANTYAIDIYKAGVLLCTLTFNAQGQMLTIRFAAPARNGSKNVSVATQTMGGWKYVLTGLEAGAQYTYRVTAKDSNDETLYTESIQFTIGIATTVESVNNYNAETPQKILRNGQIYILRDGKVYNATGAEVK